DIVGRHRSSPPPDWPGGTVRRVLITGCGDSHVAAIWGARLLSRVGADACALPAMEASERADELGPGDVLIAISASGKTPRVVEAARRARRAGARVIAITDNPAGTVPAEADVRWYLRASPPQTLSSTPY